MPRMKKSAPKLTEKTAPRESGEAVRIDAYVGRSALRKCGGVYVISRSDGRVKVGITDADFSRRRRWNKTAEARGLRDSSRRF